MVSDLLSQKNVTYNYLLLLLLCSREKITYSILTRSAKRELQEVPPQILLRITYLPTVRPRSAFMPSDHPVNSRILRIF
ncbi:hypothetical protein Desti_0935 [Desulfomonile tiedjei DSM 6799]|uniref:Uncharacterized protein n=1 Tax=Desulfomonile tiedjei (strain ATCC 49306 / DSM 6799 / DCB-1) TaxID=706587 RepID=I4C263_DESTA|nr:hypothetical protein Desti_0935 [Desulfomonile tiedjei DSM 6799]